MRAKRYSVEQIVAKLRQAEKLQGEALTIPQTCKRLGIFDQTFYRWRTRYGALKEDEAQRLKALVENDVRLRGFLGVAPLHLRPERRGVCDYDTERTSNRGYVV